MSLVRQVNTPLPPTSDHVDPSPEQAAMSKDHTAPQQKLPVAFFDFTPEQLADENLDATVAQVMAALAHARANRAARTPPTSNP